MAKYRLGAMWSKNFDYCGMLKVGSTVKATDSVVKLHKLFDSYEDVNYHTESTPLWNAINLLEAGKKAQATKEIKKFNKLSKKSHREGCGR